MSTLPTVIGSVLPPSVGSNTQPAGYYHPTYLYYAYEWQKMRDCFAGQRAIKERGATYLPPTAGMALDGLGQDQTGWHNYRAYLSRAKFTGFVASGVSTYSGLLEQKPSMFTLSPKLQNLMDKATKDGETLEQLLRRIHITQLKTGRIGLMFDVDTTDPLNPVPFIATYEAENIMNWDGGNEIQGVNRLKMVLLNETNYARDDEKFGWSLQYRYRGLFLGDGVEEPTEASTYNYSIYLEQTPGQTPSESGTPNVRGQAATAIPFVIINTTHTLPEIELPPLNDLADASLTLYRTEADYRQNLFMQGQDTLVIIGGSTTNDDSIRTGSGARIDLPLGGDAKYVGVNSQGLPELRQAVQNDMAAANQMAGNAISAAKSNAESGEAMGTRLAAQTATLNSIALTAAAGLQAVLRIGAQWFGDDPETVVVTPNLEFVDFTVPGQELQALAVSKDAGMPISYESLHGVLVDKGLTKKTWEEEQVALKGDSALREAWGLPELNPPLPAPIVQPTGIPAGGAGGTPLPGPGAGSLKKPAPGTPQKTGSE
jgi:Domain of unknown function (DUF4055)